MTSRPRFLLASDLDGTLIPPEDSARSRKAVSEFTEAAQAARPGLSLAYVTGRDLALALEGISTWGLPAPDFLACDVGTSVYRRDAGSFVKDGAYAALMHEALGRIESAEVLRLTRDVAGVRPQPQEKQGAHKASFFFPWPERKSAEAEVARRLEEAGVRGDLVVSRDAVTGEGLLDVVPAGGAKDRAVLYLAETLGLPLEAVVFAGDSGNDRTALLCGARAVLVGNASDHVRSGLLEEARSRGVDDRLYLAEGEAADGVIEGLVHWGVVTP